jgi:hypothetical protein
LHLLVLPHDPSKVAGGVSTGAVGDTAEHLTELVQQPAAVMWHRRVAAPVSAIIVAEDVGATMVVVAILEATGLPSVMRWSRPGTRRSLSNWWR